jgi:uncharacterized membrane protein HdeD (DUF308 family)
MTTFVGAPSGDAARTQWKWFMAFGVVLAVLGLVALFNAVDAALITTVFVGFVLLIGGIAQIIAAFFQSGSTGGRVLQIVLGILYVIVGGNIVADPLTGTIALTLFLGIALVVSAIIRLVAVVMERPPHTAWLVVAAIISLVLGVWLITGIPYTGVAIGLFVGIELLMAGIIWIVVAWSARSVVDASGASPA